MDTVDTSIGWGLAIAASLLVGAVAAVTLRLPARLAAVITAFGGGILFAAIALELVPEADRQAGTASVAFGLLAGTLIYVGVHVAASAPSQPFRCLEGEPISVRCISAGSCFDAAK